MSVSESEEAGVSPECNCIECRRARRLVMAEEEVLRLRTLIAEFAAHPTRVKAVRVLRGSTVTEIPDPDRIEIDF